MSEKPDHIVSVQNADSSSESANKPSTDHDGFFPWLEADAENQKFSFKKITRFPILGAFGLMCSALTVLLSLLVLKLFDGRRVVGKDNLPYLPKPAVWLSVIISINGILVHVAASKGISVSWWFRASKKQATVADLHRTWDRGTRSVAPK
jgi:hypothetical protein